MSLFDQISDPVRGLSDFIGQEITVYNFSKSWDSDDAEYDWTETNEGTARAEIVSARDPRTLTDESGAEVESDADIYLRDDLAVTIRGAGVEEEHPTEVETTDGVRYRILETHVTNDGRLACWTVEV